MIVLIFRILHCKQKKRNIILFINSKLGNAVSQWPENEVMNMHKTFPYVECVWISISVTDALRVKRKRKMEGKKKIH